MTSCSMKAIKSISLLSIVLLAVFLSLAMYRVVQAQVPAPIQPPVFSYKIIWFEGDREHEVIVTQWDYARDPRTNVPVGGAITFQDPRTGGPPIVLAFPYKIIQFPIGG